MFSQIFEMYVIQYNLIMNFVYLGQNEGRFRNETGGIGDADHI